MVGKFPFLLALKGKYKIKNPVPVIATFTPVQPPTQTAITSAIDGNENPVQNRSSTVSTSITFRVTAIAGTNPIAGLCQQGSEIIRRIKTQTMSKLQ
jgi:hypothetical protein